MDGDSSSQFSTDALGNLIGEAPGSPFITNSGDAIGAGGSVLSTGAGSLLGDLVPSLPWYVWVALGVLGFVLLRDVVK
ncbi:MAG TPA: hypothetical protein VGF92_05475 [Stellaceae bacterium]|jgi:hypothetical protein